MRPSGAKLFAAFARGAADAGADVVDIGMVSTDALYFAVGKFDFDGGVMITASHNPAQYNGMKFTRAKAEAISLDTGLAAIRDRIVSGDLPPKAATAGTISERNVLDDFAQHCLSFVDRFEDQADAHRHRRRQRNGRRNRAARLQAFTVRRRAALLRTRRKLPEPSRQPDRAREHDRLCKRRFANINAISA